MFNIAVTCAPSSARAALSWDGVKARIETDHEQGSHFPRLDVEFRRPER